MTSRWIIYLLLLSFTSNAQNLLDELGALRVKHGVPALAVVVVGPYNIITSATDGYASLADSSPINLLSGFHLGSNSKAITSLVAHYMVKAGKIRWESTVLEIFPELKDKIHKQYRKLTLADLLSHRGRIPAYTSGQEVAPWYQCREATACRMEFTRQLLSQPPLKKPGKNQFQYSNAGYVVASAMLERASNELSFENLVYLYANQNTGAVFLAGWPRGSDSLGAAGHYWRDSAWVPADEKAYDLGPVYVGAGNMYGSIIHQAALLQYFVQAWSGENENLSRQEAENLLFGKPNYAYGWGNTAENGKKMAYHDGSVGTFIARWLIYPDSQKAIAICVNASGESAKNALNEVQKQLEKKFGL